MKAIHTTPDTVLLDMSSMKRIRRIDKKNLIATFEAGVRGTDAENAVAKEGMMIGHYPQSIDVSSVGGWVSTRASGQFSSAFGSIEDVVTALEVVLPNGEVLETGMTPRAAAGSDLNYIFFGRRRDDGHRHSGHLFPALESGKTGVHRVLHSGYGTGT